MSQTASVALQPQTYTRTDYTALRAFFLKIPLERIRALYYSEDSPQVAAPGSLEQFLLSMRNDLIDRASQSNPLLGELLRKARLGGSLTDQALKVVFEAAQAKTTTPQAAHTLSMWFRPRVVSALRTTGATQLMQLIAVINTRGAGWWRSVPRIGQLRARAIESWLRTHESSIAIQLQNAAASDTHWSQSLVPGGTLTDSQLIVQPAGRNHPGGFCLIQADNDVDAAKAFLLRYRGQSCHTQDSYRRELTRLLLFCAQIVKKSIQNLTIGDCETYKDFLANPPSHLIGRKAKRGTAQWQPFATQPSVNSQRTGLRIVNIFLNWLVQVRYLASNPAATIKYPQDKNFRAQYADKALDSGTWKKLTDEIEQRCAVNSATQWRIARAAIYLWGDSGLRREEVAHLQCQGLKELEPEVWIAIVLGKGNKWREVPLSPRTMNALRAHWLETATGVRTVCLSACDEKGH